MGEVIIGLLTDEAIAGYKRLPLITFNERKLIVENLKGVEQAVPKKTFDYVPKLKELKPDYVDNGDDSKTDVQREVRQRVIDILSEWSRKLIEPNSTKGNMDNNIADSTKRDVE